VPDDPELPLLLSQVHPIHEVVRVDYFLPGCPPSADAIWSLLTAVLEERPLHLPLQQLHYD
jgi:NAD-reducing hydrogenase small subunit